MTVHSPQEAIVQSLTAVQAIIGTVHLAATSTEDPATLDTLQAVLAVALTARNALEAVAESDPIREPRRDPYATMGDGSDETPIFASLRPVEDDCSHESLLYDEEGGRLCVACGKDEW